MYAWIFKVASYVQDFLSKILAHSSSLSHACYVPPPLKRPWSD